MAAKCAEGCEADETRTKPASPRAALRASLADGMRATLAACDVEAARIANEAIGRILGGAGAEPAGAVIDLAAERVRRGVRAKKGADGADVVLLAALSGSGRASHGLAWARCQRVTVRAEVADPAGARLPWPARTERAMATWIFQGNPKTFDIDGYLAAAPVVVWAVRQLHLAPRMAPGDRVFLWRAQAGGKDPAGIIAAGYLLEPARAQPDDTISAPFWRAPPSGEDAMRVLVRIERHTTNAREIVRRDWLLDDLALTGLRILKMANETNYAIAEDHARRLEALWRNSGRNWNEAESIAGLWAYAHTFGSEVSRKPGTPVPAVALRIGRAVSSVYNKVMNFRHLDPRDTRDGLSGGGETDRKVWAMFFDAGAQQLDVARLDAEYTRLWGPNGEAASIEPESTDEAPSSAPPAVRRARGQGRESDPAVRHAVEQRAMDEASAHYAALGFDVENTAATHPFDLRCTRDGIEVRVEVKGTRGDGFEVEVTSGEVENARGDGWRTDLFVLRQIEVTRQEGAPVASGGSACIVPGWRPAPDELTPIRYRCVVPQALPPEAER